MRKTFKHDIRKLKDDILTLGSMVEQAILDSVDALKHRDISRSQKIYNNDEFIKSKEILN